MHKSYKRINLVMYTVLTSAYEVDIDPLKVSSLLQEIPMNVVNSFDLCDIF